MKTKQKIITVLLLILSFNVYAKNVGGLYLNAADFSNNKLTYENDRTTGSFKIHFRDFFGNARSFTITTDGKKQRLQKESVFGYRDCKNNVYRFYANAAYKMVDAGNIYIYSQERNIAQTKGFIVVNDYFFSTTPDGKIMPLNAGNLANAYRDNGQFLDLLDACPGDATAYDSRHKMFKINYLYAKSLKQ